MASVVTLQELRDQSRAMADQQNSGFVSPDELDSYINSCAQELYDLLVNAYEDYYLSDPIAFSATPPTLPNTFPTVTVESDLYKLRGVDILVSGGNYAPIRRFTFNERNRLQNPLVYPNYEQATIMYRLKANVLYFIGFNGPAQTVVGRYFYIPAFAKLVNGSDEFDGINGWERYISVKTAIWMKQKEESDVSVLEAELASLKERIINMSKDRDAGTPERVTDVSQNFVGPYPRF